MTQLKAIVPSGTSCSPIVTVLAAGMRSLPFQFTIQPPTVSVSPVSPTICAGSSATMTASGLANYSWSPSTGLSATTGATVTANPTSTTTYTVSGTTASGCVGSTTVTVTVVTGGRINASPSTNLCVAGYSYLTASLSGGSYAWSTGQSTQTITVYDPGTYSVTATVGGCIKTSSITVTRSGGSCIYVRAEGQEPTAEPIADLPNVTELSVFPNPAIGQFTVALPERVKANTPLTFYDMMGKELISSTIPKGQWKVSVSLENILEGMYLVKIGYDHSKIKKVMVSK